MTARSNALPTPEMTINMGPQPPSTHGVLRVILTTDGEVVTRAVPDVGYLHRGLEKIGERVTYAQYMPFTDRLDYLAAMNCNCAWAWTVEKLAKIEVPERAEYLRVIVCELNRISSHLIAFGSYTADMGAFTPFLYAIRERERVNDLFEMICGNRLTYNYARVGGVSGDAPPGFLEKTKEFLDYFEPKLDEYNNLISYNKIFVHRLAKVALIPPAGAAAPPPARPRPPLPPREGGAVLGVPEVRFQGVRGHRGARDARGLFRPVHGADQRDAGEREDRAAGDRADPRRTGAGESAARLQASGRRDVLPLRMPPRGDGDLPDQRRLGEPLPAEDPHRVLRDDESLREDHEGSDDRGRRRRHRQLRHHPPGDRSIVEALAISLVKALPVLGGAPLWAVTLLLITASAVVVLVFALTFEGVGSLVLRKVAGDIQARIGPNRVGPRGILQFLADGVKLVLKEDIIPANADRLLFKLAPYFVFVGSFAAFVVVPFGVGLIAADLNIGIYYVMAVTSLVVVGVLLAGWASNNKWALLGGMRAAAQIVSYEIPVGMALIPAVLIAGSLSLQDIVRSQGGLLGIFGWNLFHNPFTFFSFFLYFTAAQAETNQTPFDLPEAESELVSGYNVEYSGIRFGLFFLAEFGDMFIVAALATACFLGGWNVPFLQVGPLPWLWGNLLSLGVFLAKAFAMVLIMMWVRWTLPRLRVDQLMRMSWK